MSGQSTHPRKGNTSHSALREQDIQQNPPTNNGAVNKPRRKRKNKKQRQNSRRRKHEALEAKLKQNMVAAATAAATGNVEKDMTEEQKQKEVISIHTQDEGIETTICAPGLSNCNHNRNQAFEGRGGTNSCLDVGFPGSNRPTTTTPQPYSYPSAGGNTFNTSPAFPSLYATHPPPFTNHHITPAYASAPMPPPPAAQQWHQKSSPSTNCGYCNVNIVEIERTTGFHFPDICPICHQPRRYGSFGGW